MCVVCGAHDKNLKIMKKRLILSLAVVLATAIAALALDVPAGKIYFNNSLTKYDKVKFVFGSYSESQTYIMSMTDEGDDLWSVTIPEAVTGMYRYTFACTTLDDGLRADNFPNVKDYISNTLGELRTATSELSIPVGWVFTPTSGDNWASGEWKAKSSSTAWSGTLPVLFIATTDGAPIVSKEEYLTGTYYLDPCGTDFEAIGTKDKPLPLQIKGRGNYTWTGFEKKPYRLKLDKKAALMGMKKSKHFGLLACADDEMAFLRNTVGYEMSRRLGLAWTPSQQPVEVVINGSYNGLYMLTELVRVDADRVNVVEQADNETDPEKITGGWLVEIDNYQEDGQVRITEGNGATLWFTPKTPEVLSTEQRNYLTNLVTQADNAIYNSDKSTVWWERYIDIDTLVRYYIAQEMLDDTESFHGSCYWHKQNGDDTKMEFGPVWDFGCSFRRWSPNYIYVDPPYGQSWIGEIAKFDHFQEVLHNVWFQFLRKDGANIDKFVNDFVNSISAAAASDAVRWPQYAHSNILNERDNFKNYYSRKLAWLKEQWGEPEIVLGDVNLDGEVTVGDVTAIYDVILGLDDSYAEFADINGDGEVTVADVTLDYDIILGTYEPEVPHVTVNVKCDTAPGLYVWRIVNNGVEQLNGDWPGATMTETKTTSDGNTWWTKRFDVDTNINIIFNNNGGRVQTDDINDVGGERYFIYDGQSGYQDVTSDYGGGNQEPAKR